MNYIVSILIFCIVLFLYLHIYHHLKTSNDLEVYELENPSKETLEEICDIRQPVLFKYNNNDILETTQLPRVVEQYGAFDIKMRNIVDSVDDGGVKTELWLPLVLNEAVTLCRDDTKSQYLSENNSDFLEETGLVKRMKYNDTFLRPPMVSSCKYDIIFGSDGTTTPLRYMLNYRNYYMVTSGSVTIKLFNPNSSKYLYPEKDYINFEFISPVNCWNVQRKYELDFKKIKPLEVTLNEGDIIYIPSYWWFSMKFDKTTSLSVFNYRTYMNTCAMLPHIILYFLQQSNVKRECVKTHDLNNSLVDETTDSLESQQGQTSVDIENTHEQTNT